MGKTAQKEDETMTSLYACYLNDSGENTEVIGSSLEDIRDCLFAVGYEGDKVTVTKANDEVVGYADGHEFSAC